MTRLTIGCPLRQRAWVLERWYDAVLEATEKAGLSQLDISFVFAGQPHVDVETFEIVRQRARDLRTTVMVTSEPTRNADYGRRWGADRFHEMVGYRNALLGVVRSEQPAMFLSLDSDILLHPEAISSALEVLDRDQVDAVGLKCYMTSAHRTHPSYAEVGSGGLRRPEATGVLDPVGVIMAAKLMLPDAYNVNYRWHRLGEDIGWSLACRDAGVRFAWDGRITNKHVMLPEQLNTPDPRCGF